MGMFDSLKVLAEVPVTGEASGLGISWKDEIFQTKDLDNILGYYEITVDGRLRKLRGRVGWAEGDSVDSEAMGEGEEWEYVNFHGRVRFYTSHCDNPAHRWDYSLGSSQMSWSDIMEVEGHDWWLEFEATFDNGNLREIKMMDPEKTTIRARLANSKEWAERREAEAGRLGSRLARELRKIPGWKKGVRAVIKVEGAVHSSISRLLHRLA